MSNTIQTPAAAVSSTPAVTVEVVSRTAVRQNHKAELAAKVKALCDKHGLDAMWLKGLGSNGIAKVDSYFDMAKIEDKVSFMQTYSPVDVTETLLPSLLIAKEAEEKAAAQKALEVKVEEAPVVQTRPVRVLLTCQCRNCNDNPRRALTGYEGQFRFPIVSVATQILGRPATLEDLPKLAVHQLHDFVEFAAGDHMWYAEARKQMEYAIAAQKAYDDEKTAATKQLNGRQFLVALELGYWLRVGKGNDSVVLLIDEALVPEKRFIVGKSRQEFTPALMAEFSVPVWSDTRGFKRLGVELCPLAIALGLAFPKSFPQFAAK